MNKGPIQRWGEKINWEKRVKAVCKPCWELKYCPFGPLVEDFPIKEKKDDSSCRIFGHDCPVFYTAEPLTETKDLRNISRSIPQRAKFRVLKRDNQICRKCGKSVVDDDIEFDHVIPWSKGGSSDEHNVMLLCRSCNRRKGKKYEDEYLVESFSDLIIEPAPFEIIQVFTEFAKLSHAVYLEEERDITGKDICKLFERRKVRREDIAGAQIMNEIQEFFNSPKPEEISQKNFKALQFRWGFPKREFHKLKDTAAYFDIEMSDLIDLEASFMRRLSYPIKMNNTIKNRWEKL